MKQLEIQFFYPLTEQISLDLDYSPCEEYNKTKMAETYSRGVISSDYSISYTTTGSNITSSFVIDKDNNPVTIRTQKKPNIIERALYKSLGFKWESK